MIGVLGGGFSLYAWMPALCQFYPNETILLEERHKEKFDKRPELQCYKNRIEWIKGDKNISFFSELLILAIPPHQVYQYLPVLKAAPQLKKLIVEKPVCETPEKSEKFIKQIENKGIKICSSYLFIYTDWFKELDPNKQYKISWVKSNDNSKDSWKHKDELGGGSIFYKIHLYAIMNYLDNIQGSFLSIKTPNNNTLIIVNKTDNNFIETSPFEEQFNGEDDRIPCLKKLLFDFENNYEKVNKLMKDTNLSWQLEKNLK